jgi:alkyl sulfatase BDS1-like metallo-beta-lactamase superfamily hydrolase
MATAQQCREALDQLAARLAANAADARKRLDLNRTLACRITDLNTAFHATLTNGQLLNITDGDNPTAKIALTTTSDDLLALVQGHLDLPKAIATRRVHLQANPFDLLKLRKLL